MDNFSIYICLFPLVALLAVLAIVLANQRLWGATFTIVGLMWLIARMSILRLISNNFAPLLTREENRYVQSFLASDVTFAVTAVFLLVVVIWAFYEVITGVAGRKRYVK